MIADKWYIGKIISGKKLATALGFPTLNLDNPTVLKNQKVGVYACQVKIRENIYNGILFYGPRLILGESENILEIFVFDFKQKIYGEMASFHLIKYLRPPKKFDNQAMLKKQLMDDYRKAKKILSPFPKP